LAQLLQGRFDFRVSFFKSRDRVFGDPGTGCNQFLGDAGNAFFLEGSDGAQYRSGGPCGAFNGIPHLPVRLFAERDRHLGDPRALGDQSLGDGRHCFRFELGDRLENPDVGIRQFCGISEDSLSESFIFIIRARSHSQGQACPTGDPGVPQVVQEVGEQEPDGRAQSRNQELKQEPHAEERAQADQHPLVAGGHRTLVNDLAVFPDIHPVVREPEEQARSRVGRNQTVARNLGRLGEPEDGEDPGKRRDNKERSGEDQFFEPPRLHCHSRSHFVSGLVPQP
jgi:hypothetical protein